MSVTTGAPPLSTRHRRPGRIVVAVVIIVMLRLPAGQIQPVIDSLIGLTGLGLAWDVLPTTHVQSIRQPPATLAG